jgi:hypothetical protein
MKKRPVGAEVFHADGQTELHSRFSQFCARAQKSPLYTSYTSENHPSIPVLPGPPIPSHVTDKWAVSSNGLPLLYF